jgi:hypothetical protein
MNMPPGKWFGPILDAVYEHQLEGKLTTKEEAKLFALEIILLAPNGTEDD